MFGIRLNHNSVQNLVASPGVTQAKVLHQTQSTKWHSTVVMVINDQFRCFPPKKMKIYHNMLGCSMVFQWFPEVFSMAFPHISGGFQPKIHVSSPDPSALPASSTALSWRQLKNSWPRQPKRLPSAKRSPCCQPATKTNDPKMSEE